MKKTATWGPAPTWRPTDPITIESLREAEIAYRNITHKTTQR